MKAILSSTLASPSDALRVREPRPAPSWLEIIRQSVEAVDFGTIQIKVHGGEVVQIETTRKIRVPSALSHFQPTAPAEVEQPTR